MCLTVDQQKTKDFNPKSKVLTFYKAFCFRIDCLYSPYQYDATRFNFIDFKTTIHELDIDVTRYNGKVTRVFISGGCFHAFVTNHKNAFFMVPIHVLAEDVIAFGLNNDVCFWKYKIPQSSWNLIQIYKDKFENELNC